MASGVRFGILKIGLLLAYIQSQSSLVESIKVVQGKDLEISKWKDEVKEGGANRFTLDEEGTLRFEG